MKTLLSVIISFIVFFPFGYIAGNKDVFSGWSNQKPSDAAVVSPEANADSSVPQSQTTQINANINIIAGLVLEANEQQISVRVFNGFDQDNKPKYTNTSVSITNNTEVVRATVENGRVSGEEPALAAAIAVDDPVVVIFEPDTDAGDNQPAQKIIINPKNLEPIAEP